VLIKALLCLGLLNASAAWAAAPGFLLGMDYSERFGFAGQSVVSLATDGSGAVYLLASTYDTTLLTPTTALGPVGGNGSFVAKLSSDGNRIVYLTILGFEANAMAVDQAGNAYIAGPGGVAKLNPTGTAWVYQATIGTGVLPISVAVDQGGHAFVLGFTTTGVIQTSSNAFQRTIPNTSYSHAFVLRLNAAGTAFDYATYLTGTYSDQPSQIAVDGSGAAVVSGLTTSTDFPATPGAYVAANDASRPTVFLARLLPDGSGLVYSDLPASAFAPSTMAVDPNGNAAIAPSGNLLHFNPAGALTFSGSTAGLSPVAMDSAGNTYAFGYSTNGGAAVRNSLFTCQQDASSSLTVYDTDGNILQATYLPPIGSASSAALGPNAEIYVLGGTNINYTPTQSLSGMSNIPFSLTRLAQHAGASTVQLACVTNAASYYPGPIAGGEIVSLFGQALGPPQGTAPQVDLQNGFPTQVSEVRVTINGSAAPLLYVQDGQVNAIVPWALASASTAQICVSYNGSQTNCLPWAVSGAAPGVFTVDGVHAAALNQDGTINSAENPAAPDSIVSVFATGLGAIGPPQNDGAIVAPPLPVNDLQFVAAGRVGGIVFVYAPVPTEYAGPAPYLVAGASQINFTVTNSDLRLQTAPGSSADFSSQSFTVYVAGQ